jgi:hypothetical protein
MKILPNIEEKYLSKKIFLYQEFIQFRNYKKPIISSFLSLNHYGKKLLIKSRFQSSISLRNIRKNLGFPVRGQRTCSNSKTAKKRL